MKPNKSTFLILPCSSALVIACGSAKSNPTWLDDVRPLVQANCVRCHTPPSIGGAPTDFRLDVYEDTLADNGNIVRGAKTMAPFMAERAASGSMPPDQALADLHGDTFANWAATGATLGSRPDNLSPRAELRSELGATDSEEYSIEFDVDDAQHDLVWGDLRVGDIVVTRSLHNGRNLVRFQSGALPQGDHAVVAHLSDDENPVRRALGNLRVRHQDGVAPLVSVSPELRDRLISEASVELQIDIADDDAAQTHEISIVAFRGLEEVMVANAAPDTGPRTTIRWDTSSLPEGPGWRLRTTLVDSAGASTTTESDRFIVSHQETTLRFDDVSGLFAKACGTCHPRAAFDDPDLDLFLASEGDPLHAEVVSRSGLIYRRVIQEGNMPPVSAPAYAESVDDLGFEPLSSEEKARLAAYLLGGSPR